jgi:hypothetical protein
MPFLNDSESIEQKTTRQGSMDGCIEINDWTGGGLDELSRTHLSSPLETPVIAVSSLTVGGKGGQGLCNINGPYQSVN